VINRLSFQEIHSDFVAVLGIGVVAHSTAAKDRRRRQLPSSLCNTLEKIPTVVIDNAFLDMMKKQHAFLFRS
jgi:hypothetical protein